MKSSTKKFLVLLAIVLVSIGVNNRDYIDLLSSLTVVLLCFLLAHYEQEIKDIIPSWLENGWDHVVAFCEKISLGTIVIWVCVVGFWALFIFGWISKIIN